MVTSKMNKREILRAAKEKDRPERANVTFLLKKTLYETFRKQCGAEKVGLTAVLEALLEDFIKQ